MCIRDRSYTTLDDPSASISNNNGTSANGIDGGNIVGEYTDGNNQTHGFLYNIATNTYATLDAPNAGGHTQAIGISDGNIVGVYGNGTHSFLYNLTTQSYTILDDPAADPAGSILSLIHISVYLLPHALELGLELLHPACRVEEPLLAGVGRMRVARHVADDDVVLHSVNRLLLFRCLLYTSPPFFPE